MSAPVLINDRRALLLRVSHILENREGMGVADVNNSRRLVFALRNGEPIGEDLLYQAYLELRKIGVDAITLDLMGGEDAPFLERQIFTEEISVSGDEFHRLFVARPPPLGDAEASA